MVAPRGETLNESLGPSVVVVVAGAEVGSANAAVSDAKARAGKEKRRAMVFCRHRTCGVLLRTGDDDAAGRGSIAESGYVLSWRSDDGSAEGLANFLKA